MSNEDMKKVMAAVKNVEESREAGIKCTLEISLTSGTAKVYHMGAHNPTIRIDLKLNK